MLIGTNQRNALLADKVAATGFSLLVGASFSLWRAAFLSDIERSWENVIDKGTDLLRTVLVTNAVPFSTDRHVRDWMMGYYLSNARYRLAEAIERLSIPQDSEALVPFRKLHPHGILDTDQIPTDIWDAFMGTFNEVLQALKDRLARAQ
jgi:hypothetical protein